MASLTEKLKDVLYPYTLIIGALPAIFGTLTIFACYHTTVNVQRHLPSWLWMPVISLLGCAEPESTYYQIGFAATGLSTLLFFITFQRSILRYIPGGQFQAEKRKLKWTVLFAAFGIFGQGVITMEESAINGITKTSDASVQWQPGSQSIIHQALAAVFFISAMIHGYNAIVVYQSCTQQPFPSMTLSKYFKILTFAFPLCFQSMSFVYHPIRSGTKSQNELNMAGLAQWISVFCYLLFFASYAIDHLSIQNVMKTSDSKDKKVE
mmetsp:Transcript_25062/g.40665  ORF Transcript_25062/g.40665 Transcript_25062/m.40665 type:complete len:265 (+) Transcript_25062:52-846(+)